MAVGGHRTVRTRKIVRGEGVNPNPSPRLRGCELAGTDGTGAEELGDPLGAGQEQTLGRWEPLAVFGLAGLVRDANDILIGEAVQQHVRRRERRLGVGQLGDPGGVKDEATVRADPTLPAGDEPALLAFVRLDVGVVQFVTQVFLAPRGRATDVELLQQRPGVRPRQVEPVGEDAGCAVGGGVSALAGDGGGQFGEIGSRPGNTIFGGHRRGWA